MLLLLFYSGRVIFLNAIFLSPRSNSYARWSVLVYNIKCCAKRIFKTI